MAGNIHRQKKNRDFVTIDTHCLRNKDLRWDAKGLHSYLMQLPDDWKINVADLEKRSLDRHDGTMSPMRALIAAGYVYRERISGEKGRFVGYDYHLFERPEQTVEWLTVNGKSIDGKTVNGKSTTSKVLKPLSEVSKNEGEGERTPPAPNNSTSKEEKKENGLVAPGREWSEEDEAWYQKEFGTVKAENPPSPNSAAPPSPLNIGFCGSCMGLGYRNGRNGRETCEVCEGSGNGDQKIDAKQFEVTAIASPTDLPGVIVVEAAPPTGPGQPDPPKSPKKASPSAPTPHQENQEVFSYFDNAEKIGTAWRKWITEKWGQHKCKFKTVESEKIALRQLWELSGGKSDAAEKIIDQSIANTWKGLFALKIQNNGTKPTIADRRKQATADMLRHVAEFGLG